MVASLRRITLAASTLVAAVAFTAPCVPSHARTTSGLVGDHSPSSSTLCLSTNESLEESRRDILLHTVRMAALASLSVNSRLAWAGDDEYLYKRKSEDGDLTTKLFNEDGSPKDAVVEAQEKTITVPLSLPRTPSSISVSIFEDGVVKPTGQTPSAEDTNTVSASYKLPLKWNLDPSDKLPLYFDSSEGKNGKALQRATIYSVSASKVSLSTLEKASRVGVASSLFMDKLPNNYFDQGVAKADLIGGRTSRKPIKSEIEGGIDEQVYYEFDVAFAPKECPDFSAGNKENLGLGFCPYDNIFLVSATVLENDDGSGNMIVAVLECNKDEWKIGNADLKRARSSFTVERG
ncbi:hypothetical protein THAOC_03728 [Thalassiosira oceanica]|uniref:PsbP C-terminal domain-containing protein n=1 Tax=Thalassiosira oceanica TaxID=159749 RepID=K0TBT0_THAOC|nr:hypothetical protein THAOC_03728 [Thalassiosira oceanica]|eukprot:EJK74584.1 hypothetical protein THAOC_03728 [Thalassiosira oceanica]